MNHLRSLSKPVILVLMMLGLSCSPAVEPADLVLRNGKIVTVDPEKPEARAVAVKGDRIAVVGSDEEIQAFISSSTRVIDLEGRLAIPGFIEGHGHFTSLGEARLNLDLTGARNWQAVVSMVEKAVADTAPGEWILGRGWHQEKWDQIPSPSVEGLPRHEALSKISARNPVLLVHASGHASFANAEAMRAAGVSAATENPEGGEIVHDSQGNPTGVFRETAQGLLRDALDSHLAAQSPEMRQVRARKVIDLATRECLSKGITSFQDAGSSFETIDLFRQLAEKGELDLRLWVMIREGNAALAEKIDDYRLTGAGNHHLTVRAIKRSIDGALGSHGAWLLEPYSDLPRSAGLNTTTVKSITETARLAIQHGFQLCVHAIGDRANREVLDLFEKVFREHPAKEDRRWRIEHAQHLHPDDIPRFAQLDVIASMQAIHATSDAPWVIPRLGEERAREGAYVWAQLFQSGALVTNGTDAPVEDVSPLHSYYASVSRRLQDGSVFYPDQRMTREQALRSYTWNAAYAAFEEDIKGSLSPGKLADITVLSRDILTIPENEIPATEVVFTIVGGEVTYSVEKP